MVQRYTPPSLNGPTVIYKGKRYWIFRIDQEHPFEGYEEYSKVIVYDKLDGVVAAYCSEEYKGELNLGSFQQVVEVHGSDPKSLIANVQTQIKCFERLVR